MKNKIIILTAPIRYGKSTFLKQLLPLYGPWYGIICPNIDGKKNVLFLPDGRVKNLEASTDHNGEVLSVGRFIFDKSVMQEVSEYLSNLVIGEKMHIIVDEVGKLEIADSGFEPGISNLISKFICSNANAALIIVVRDYLVKEVILKYNLSSALVVDMTQEGYQKVLEAELSNESY